MAFGMAPESVNVRKYRYKVVTIKRPVDTNATIWA